MDKFHFLFRCVPRALVWVWFSRRCQVGGVGMPGSEVELAGPGARPAPLRAPGGFSLSPGAQHAGRPSLAGLGGRGVPSVCAARMGHLRLRVEGGSDCEATLKAFWGWECTLLPHICPRGLP